MVIALNGGQPPLASEPAGTATAWPDDGYQKMEDLVIMAFTSLLRGDFLL